MSSFFPLSEALKNELIKNVSRVTYPKKTLLLREGEMHNSLYFIEKGILRTFIRKNKEDITTLFIKENDFLVSSFRFVNQHSLEYIEVLEDATILVFNYEDITKLYQDFPEANILGRTIIEHTYYRTYHRLITMLKFSTKEQYEMLIEQQPDLFQRVPLSHIASFLGIKKESLSRIRKNII